MNWVKVQLQMYFVLLLVWLFSVSRVDLVKSIKSILTEIKIWDKKYLF